MLIIIDKIYIGIVNTLNQSYKWPPFIFRASSESKNCSCKMYGSINKPMLCQEIIIKSLDPLRAKKTFIRKKLGHTAVSAIKASSVTL